MAIMLLLLMRKKKKERVAQTTKMAATDLLGTAGTSK